MELSPCTEPCRKRVNKAEVDGMVVRFLHDLTTSLGSHVVSKISNTDHVESLPKIL